MRIINQEKLLYPNSICLNISSSCKLRCKWCYKQAEISQNLNYRFFELFYNQIIKDRIQVLSLIGGEPTEHIEFFSFLKKIKNKYILLNTNGINFSKIEFLNQCLDKVDFKKNKNLFITLSIKGYDEKSFFEVTGNKCFDALCDAIYNIQKRGVPRTYTYIYDRELNAEERLKFISFLDKYHISQLVISDLRPYKKRGKKNFFPESEENLDELIYQLIGRGVDAYVRLNLPLCEYSKQFVFWLIQKRRLFTSCAVKRRQGFFFSSELDLIACNQFGDYSLGKFGTDFSNYEELCEYWNDDSIKNIFKKISGYPMEKCVTCNLWRICGGGCILNWKMEVS